jgi:DNA repair protein RadC
VSSVADLPLDERPRERLMRHGAATLSSAELVAILLGSGMAGKNAVQLGRELLTHGIAGLASIEPAQLARTKGVGAAKAGRIAAAFELSRRAANGIADEPQSYDPAVVGRSLIHTHAHLPQEHLGAVFLDSRHRIIRQREIFIGTINSALVSTREILKYALDERATAVVLFHNHPSGNPSPSAEDLIFTQRARQSLKLVDIDLVDHLVIGASSYTSMAERGQLN